MLPKIVRTTFLALGLAMLWLGFFYNYELKKEQAVVVSSQLSQSRSGEKVTPHIQSGSMAGFFGEEQDEMPAEFPLILAFAGLVFLTGGCYSCQKEE